MKHFIKILRFLPLLAFWQCTQQVSPSADVPVVSYAQEISPIISANCSISGCHDGSSDLFPLLSYDDLLQRGA
ncbi:MAG: hypothetical protein IPL65_02110 [Lewinellaceae bacterium]|nr:hypothetical protein [Lewinellaceae bacterium]